MFIINKIVEYKIIINNYNIIYKYYNIIDIVVIEFITIILSFIKRKKKHGNYNHITICV